MKQTYFKLFVLVILLKGGNTAYDIEYIEPQCRRDSTAVFFLGSSGRHTSFIVKDKQSYGYGANMDCNITISASHVRNGHVMLTIRELDFDDPGRCRDYLEIYNDNNVVKKMCGNFDHRKSEQSFTSPRGKQMKFHYHTVYGSSFHSGFEIVATAYTDGPCSGNFNFRCNNYNCISMSLICDGYNNCGDDSDETKDKPASCRLSAGAVAGIVIGVLLLIALVSTIIWCCQRKRTIIKTVYQTPAPVVIPNVQQTASYQQSPGGIQNPSYGLPPPPYKQ